ncbi:hypothetical protein CIB84_007235 [Bambusicola thoracicus]|uniref:Uncharacterized protein n=1 Tax=Bambusicola thoracicus TaxID=9083 RepID=A0A2P4SY21_BAMTH|nr:hypothetical protein CIB84_007235 [Bambusicola thoracicus]
MRQYNFIKLM